jgi:hypothetical protein
VTKTENVVCHFYHRDFERCKIIDAHLAPMAKRFMETRFIKVSAPVSQQAAGCWWPLARMAPTTLGRLLVLAYAYNLHMCCRVRTPQGQHRVRSILFAQHNRLLGADAHLLAAGPCARVAILQDAPFFTVKLGIRVLPCIVLFKHGRVVSKIVGFDQLGGKDDFSTASLEKQLHAAGLTTSSSSKAAAHREESDEEDEEPDTRSSIRTGFHNNQKTASDEDSDFE